MRELPHGTVSEAHGARDALVAALCVVLGAALVGPLLAHAWPAGLLPPDTGRADYAYNVRILKLMLLLEGCGLAALGVLAATRGVWLRERGGVHVLDRHAGIALGALCGVHVVSLWFFFPPQQILSPEPVHTGLHAAQYYRLFAAHRLLSNGGRLWGYDPYFLAGYPAGTVFDPDTRGAELFAHATAFLGLAFASKAFIVLVHAVVPLVVYGAARILGIGRAAALLGAWLGVVFWHWGHPVLGTLRWTGMHSYLLGAQLAVLGAACAVRFLDANHRVRAAALAATTAIAVMMGGVHPAGLALLLPACVLVLATGSSRLRRRDGVAAGVALAAVVAVHATWLLPLWRQRALLAPVAPGLQLHGLGDVLDYAARPTSLPAVALVVLGCAAAWHGRNVRPHAAIVLGGALLALGLAAAFGARVRGLARFETARFLVAMPLFAAPFAGIALRGAAEVLQRAFGRPLALLGLCVAWSLPPFAAVLDARFFYVNRLDATLDPRFGELLRAVDAASPVEGRVLFESTDGGPFSDGAPLEALVPLFVRREMVGPPQPGMALVHARLGLGHGTLAGRPLAAWRPAELGSFLWRYNVGAVVAWSDAARGFFAVQDSLLEPATSLHGFDLYRVRARPAAVARGAARVRADYGRLEVTGAAGPEIVLKYRWMDGLRARPDVTLERVPVAGDPVGFIGLHPGTYTHLVIESGR